MRAKLGVFALISWVALATGCATCSPTCCEECAPIIETLPCPPDVTIAPTPPALPVPDTPTMTSAIPEAAAKADPESWLRSAMADLVAYAAAFVECRDTVVAVNETRAPPPPE